jgi:hypothetical protein
VDDVLHWCWRLLYSFEDGFPLSGRRGRWRVVPRASNPVACSHKQGEFTASDPDKLIAWYFIDFNDGALKEQQEKHWDGSNEEFLDPMPLVA